MIDPIMPIPRYIGNFYPKCSSKIRRRAIKFKAGELEFGKVNIE